MSFDRDGRAGAQTTDPPAGALVRVPAREQGWTASLPPAPAEGVTVSCSSPAVAAGSAQDLDRLGYRLVRTPSSAPSSAATAAGVADFLVPSELMAQHATWWRALAAEAQQVFNLAFGPVAEALSETLAAHLRPTRPHSTRRER